MLCREACHVKSGHGVAEITLLHCKLWSCPICEPRNYARLRSEIQAGKPSKFITFTCRPGTFGEPARQARVLKRKVRQVFEEWRRRNPEAAVEWIAVLEAHKSGWPHVHVLARAPSLDWRELRAIWEELTGSFRVDIRKVKTVRGVARYAAKYVTKGSQVEGWGKRHWCSQGWLAPDDDPPVADSTRWYSVEVVEGDAEALAAAYSRVGFAVEEARGTAWYRVRAP